MIKPKPQIKLRHSDKGEIIEVKVFRGDEELSQSSKEYAEAVKKLRDYGSSIR